MENQTLSESVINIVQREWGCMGERQFEKTDSVPPVSQPSNKEDLRRCVEAEIVEMEKYKWCLGIALQHDPLIDRSLNEIYCEWIDKYAADFRRYWQSKDQAAGATGM
jgi:hypothetical protein